MRTHWTDRIRLARHEPHLFFWFTQEKPNAPFENVEGILNVRVAMPWHVLCRRDLQFRNPEARPLRMIGAAFDDIEMAGVFDRFHPPSVAVRARVLKRQIDDISAGTDWLGKLRTRFMRGTLRRNPRLVSSLLSRCCEEFRSGQTYQVVLTDDCENSSTRT